MQIYDKIPAGKPFNRCTYIKNWLNSMPEIESYVAIDDLNLSDEFPYNFVQTSEFVGLTMDNAKSGINILEKMV